MIAPGSRVTIFDSKVFRKGFTRNSKAEGLIFIFMFIVC